MSCTGRACHRPQACPYQEDVAMESPGLYTQLQCCCFRGQDCTRGLTSPVHGLPRCFNVDSSLWSDYFLTGANLCSLIVFKLFLRKAMCCVWSCCMRMRGQSWLERISSCAYSHLCGKQRYCHAMHQPLKGQAISHAVKAMLCTTWTCVCQQSRNALWPTSRDVYASNIPLYLHSYNYSALFSKVCIYTYNIYTCIYTYRHRYILVLCAWWLFTLLHV